ncbi:hypothetical protein [Paraburkholderia graminis]|uniref:hypothetical protein n=1 Tax=Paraburkholderia graminis TaxID=60548 RepID=UPI0038BCAA68
MLQFSKQFAPEALESIARFHDGDTAHVLDRLERAPKAPWHLLRLREQPSLEDGFFSLLAQPFREVNGILRNYDRGADLRPEARAIWFNGIIPFECFEVLPFQPGRAP